MKYKNFVCNKRVVITPKSEPELERSGSVHA
jgi:hypothetical protein